MFISDISTQLLQEALILSSILSLFVSQASCLGVRDVYGKGNLFVRVELGSLEMAFKGVGSMNDVMYDVSKSSLLTRTATIFREHHRKHLGFGYTAAITPLTGKSKYRNQGVFKKFINLCNEHSVSIEDYFSWFFTIKIKQIKSANFFFCISSGLFNDYLIWRQFEVSSVLAIINEGAKGLVNHGLDIRRMTRG